MPAVCGGPGRRARPHRPRCQLLWRLVERRQVAPLACRSPEQGGGMHLGDWFAHSLWKFFLVLPRLAWLHCSCACPPARLPMSAARTSRVGVLSGVMSQTQREPLRPRGARHPVSATIRLVLLTAPMRYAPAGSLPACALHCNPLPAAVLHCIHPAKYRATTQATAQPLFLESNNAVRRLPVTLGAAPSALPTCRRADGADV